MIIGSFRACFLVPAPQEVGHLFSQKIPKVRIKHQGPSLPTDASILGCDSSVHRQDLVSPPSHCRRHCSNYDHLPVDFHVTSYLIQLLNTQFLSLSSSQKPPMALSRKTNFKQNYQIRKYKHILF